MGNIIGLIKLWFATYFYPDRIVLKSKHHVGVYDFNIEKYLCCYFGTMVSIKLDDWRDEPYGYNPDFISVEAMCVKEFPHLLLVPILYEYTYLRTTSSPYRKTLKQSNTPDFTRAIPFHEV